jgi:hypothetical protein
MFHRFTRVGFHLICVNSEEAFGKTTINCNLIALQKIGINDQRERPKDVSYYPNMSDQI